MRREHAPPGHVQPQPHAVAVADLPLLLQVLRVRDAQGASARARRGAGGCSTRRSRAITSRSLLVLTGETARGQRRGRARGWRSTGTRTSSPTWSGSASVRSSAACCRTPTSACSERERPGAAARGDGVAGPDARVGLRAADGDRPRGLADQASGAPDRDDRGRGGAAGSRSRAGSWSGSARPRTSGWRRSQALGRAARAPRPPAGGDPAELRPAPELLRARAGARSPTRAAHEYWRTGLSARARARCPGVGVPGHRSRTSSGWSPRRGG